MKINKEVTTTRRFRHYIAMMGRDRSILSWRLVAAVALLSAIAYMSGIPRRELYLSCELAVKNRSNEAVAICAENYALTGDIAIEAKLARALQRDGAGIARLESIANDVGDASAGADAHLALGLAYEKANQLKAALAAFQRAVANRPKTDAFGRMSDAVALMKHYQGPDDFQQALGQAAIAYEMALRVEPQWRGVALINISTLMLQLGNPEIADGLLEEAEPLPRELVDYLWLPKGLLERARGNARWSTELLRKSREFAQRTQRTNIEWDVRCDQIEGALLDGELDDAQALIDGLPLAPGASESDRSADAYYRAWLALARKQFIRATQLAEEGLAIRAPSWTAWLEATRGRAFLEAGDLDRAEPVLRRAIAEIEHKRDALDYDTLRSWWFARMRAPYEDLVRLYIARGLVDHRDYTLEAFAVIQQATTRSTLDGLLLTKRPVRATGASGLPMMQQWADGMKKLARSLRTSAPAQTPSVQSVLAGLRGNHVITYFRAGDDLWAFVVSRDGTLTVRSLGKAAPLSDKAQLWRERPDDREDLAVELGEALLPDDLLPPAGIPIYIVADQAVADLSFAALRRNGHFVVAQHPVAYGPSAAVLASALRSSAPDHAIVLGDPKGDLKGARQEAEAAASELKVKAMVGPEATTDAVLSATQATLVHIASHTVSTEVGIALQLSDGVIDAATIIDRGHSAGALVLLNCSSGAPTNSDEMAPLASAFLAAGAHTVVASRWAIPDGIGTQFASAFYRARGASDPVNAVAEAQRELISRHVPVAQWSSFVVLGGIH